MSSQTVSNNPIYSMAEIRERTKEKLVKSGIITEKDAGILFPMFNPTVIEKRLEEMKKSHTLGKPYVWRFDAAVSQDTIERFFKPIFEKMGYTFTYLGIKNVPVGKFRFVVYYPFPVAQIYPRASLQKKDIDNSGDC